MPEQVVEALPEPPLATIFDLQKFSVHDGPGIRTLVFFKGCPLRCLWCSNPESQSSQLELVFYPQRCRRLNRCIEACPTHAIVVEGDALHLKKELCDLCGMCAEACYAGAWKLFGESVDVDYIMREVDKDASFYRLSGGGVTFGGGEALLWPKIVRHLGEECKSRGYHTTVETCGYVSWSAFDEVLDVIDLVLYDLKHMDSATHELLCGAGNELILENLESLFKTGVSVTVRVPVIPGTNDSDENIHALGRFLKAKGGRNLELLPYHRLGVPKYERLRRFYECEDVEVPEAEHMAELGEVLERYGLSVKVRS